MVATSFTLNIRKDLAMLRKERAWIVRAGSGIVNAFKAGYSHQEWFSHSLF